MAILDPNHPATIAFYTAIDRFAKVDNVISTLRDAIRTICPTRAALDTKKKVIIARWVKLLTDDDYKAYTADPKVYKRSWVIFDHRKTVRNRLRQRFHRLRLMYYDNEHNDRLRAMAANHGAIAAGTVNQQQPSPTTLAIANALSRPTVGLTASKAKKSTAKTNSAAPHATAPFMSSNATVKLVGEYKSNGGSTTGEEDANLSEENDKLLMTHPQRESKQLRQSSRIQASRDAEAKSTRVEFTPAAPKRRRKSLHIERNTISDVAQDRSEDSVVGLPALLDTQAALPTSVTQHNVDVPISTTALSLFSNVEMGDYNVHSNFGDDVIGTAQQSYNNQISDTMLPFSPINALQLTLDMPVVHTSMEVVPQMANTDELALSQLNRPVMLTPSLAVAYLPSTHEAGRHHLQCNNTVENVFEPTVSVEDVVSDIDEVAVVHQALELVTDMRQSIVQLECILRMKADMLGTAGCGHNNTAGSHIEGVDHPKSHIWKSLPLDELRSHAATIKQALEAISRYIPPAQMISNHGGSESVPTLMITPHLHSTIPSPGARSAFSSTLTSSIGSHDEMDGSFDINSEMTTTSPLSLRHANSSTSSTLRSVQ